MRLSLEERRAWARLSRAQLEGRLRLRRLLLVTAIGFWSLLALVLLVTLIRKAHP